MNINSKKYIILLLVILFSVPILADSYSFSPLKSAILPGWGQISNDHKAGFIHLGLEVAFVSSLIYFSNEATIKQDQSVSYAIKYAHINPINHPESYYKTIGRYSSSYYEAGGYNQEVLNDAIANNPGDPIAQQNYINENAIPDDLNWRWDSKSNRFKYNELRQDYFFNQDYAKIATGVLVANHVFSFLDMLIRYKNRDIADKYTMYSTIDNNMTPMLNLLIKF
jgi:hypothetical protein